MGITVRSDEQLWIGQVRIDGGDPSTRCKLVRAMPFSLPLSELLDALRSSDPPMCMRGVVCGMQVLATLKQLFPKTNFNGDLNMAFFLHIAVSGEEDIPADAIYLLDDDGKFYEEDPRKALLH